MLSSFGNITWKGKIIQNVWNKNAGRIEGYRYPKCDTEPLFKSFIKTSGNRLFSALLFAKKG